MRTFLTLVTLVLTALIASAEEDWPMHLVDSFTQEHHIAPPVDFDYDGDLDLIAYSRYGDQVTAWLNDGAGNFASLVLVDGLSEPRQIGTGDFDSDGDNDLAVVDNSTLYVYFNQGNNQFTQLTLDSNGFLVHWMKVRDIDLDGVQDVLLPYPGGAKWYRYNGAGAFDGFLIDTGVELWWDTEVADIDSDGDNDFITEITSTQQGIFWIENVGNTTFELRERISTSFAFDIHIVDMNHDGTPDIFLPYYDGLYCLSYQDNAFASHLLSSDNSVREMKSADLDLDGDEDLVYNSGHLHRTGWSQYRGDTQFNDQRLFESPHTVDELYLGDFDLDQDIDVVAVERDVSPVAAICWWENPDYQVGLDLTRSVDHHGLVTLKWADLNADGYQIKRDGVVIATITGTEYTDQLSDYLLHEFVVTANPQDPSSKPSYPVKALWPDPDEIALLEEFNLGKPPSWSVERSTSTMTTNYTWNSTTRPDLFDSRYMSIGWHHLSQSQPPELWEGRLVTPWILKTSDSRVELMFDQSIMLITSQCRLQYFVEDGPIWPQLSMYSDGQDNQQFFDLTDVLANHTRFKIGFDFNSDTGCNRWAIDDVTIVVEDQPIDLELIPQNTIIPASGGDLVYNASLASSLGSSFTELNFWLTVKLPGGQVFSRYVAGPFDLPAYGDLSMPGLVLSVPETAPAGEYLVIGYVGRRPRFHGPIIQDRFLFVKEGPQALDGSDYDMSDWMTANATNTTLDVTGQFPLPVVYTLHAVYPNPFNPTTTISVSLPEAANLTVTVVNTLGQQVAELTNGHTAAGTHAFTFDASSLASGIYFVHATVPGELNAVQKVVLMK